MQIEFETSEHDPFLAKIITIIISFFIHDYWRITHNFFDKAASKHMDPRMKKKTLKMIASKISFLKLSNLPLIFEFSAVACTNQQAKKAEI